MIAIVVPTIRPESYKAFREAWDELIKHHGALLVTVWDGDSPYVQVGNDKYSVKDIMGNRADLIFNWNDGVRNLGFAFVAKRLQNITSIITLDDDTKPFGDTIRDHVEALNQSVPVSWLSTASEFMRGFPYGVRGEAEVVLSHGVWEGVKDYDAPTQLVKGNMPVQFYKGPIPKGVFYPMCGMNIAFKPKMLPFMYYAPMGQKVGVQRFADIWLGIESKNIIDENGWAVVSGYSKVRHERASNVFTNLEQEGKGIRLNENYGQDEYFKMYELVRKGWEEFINERVR